MVIDVQMHAIRNDQDILDYRIANKNKTYLKYEGSSDQDQDKEKVENALTRLSEAPSVWIGTLPTKINPDNPDAITELINYIGDSYPSLTEELYTNIVSILAKAQDDGSYQVADEYSLKEFFDEHKNSYIFIMKW